MAYQLRSRKDPVVPETQEQTDTSVDNPIEIQVTTISQTMFVPPLLSNIEHEALPLAEASRTQSQTGLNISTKPEMLSQPQLDITGPTRLDPGLGSATLSVGATSTGIHLATQQLAPLQPSAVIGYQSSPADLVGPPSTVMASRDTPLTGNRIPPFYDTIETSSPSFVHDSKEVKHTTQAGTTLASNVVVARPLASSLHTSTSTYSLQQSESVVEQQEWFPTDDSTSMPDLSPHYADLELSPAEMASLPETVLTSLLAQTAIPLQHTSQTLATRQRAPLLSLSIPQSIAPSSTEAQSVAVRATAEDLLQAASLLASFGERNPSSETASTKSDEGHASFVSDSTPLGDTDIEPLRAQHKIWLPKSTEALDAYSAHTDKTVVPQTVVPLHRCHSMLIHIHQELVLVSSNNLHPDMELFPRCPNG